MTSFWNSDLRTFSSRFAATAARGITSVVVAATLAVVGISTLSSASFAATPQPGYPVPQIVGPTNPTAVAPGGPGFTLKVYGANFIAGSVVNWNKQARATMFVSGHELDAQILASDIATNTAGMITVTTTSPNGPIISSTYAQMEVHVPTATFVPVSNPQTFQFMLPPFLLADWNNDGNLDYAGVSNDLFKAQEIAPYFGSPSGVLTRGKNATLNYYNCAYSWATGDFNGDGMLDLIYYSGNASRGSLSPLQVNLGKGDGTFTRFARFATQQGLLGNILVVGDFNQDGILDFVQSEPRGLRVFLGNGDGSFSRGSFVAGGGNANALFAADLNGDGRLDLVENSVGTPSNLLRVLLGNGDGTFQKAVVVGSTAPASRYPYLVVTDLNNDGIPDLVYNDNNFITLQLGNGDGTFQPAVMLSSMAGGVLAGDFNSDGNIDLISFYGTTPFFLAGNGDGTFQSAQNVAIASGAFPVAGDINGDGLLDIISDDGIVYLQQ